MDHDQPVSSDPPLHPPVLEPTLHPVLEPALQPVLQPTLQPALQPVIQPTLQPHVDQSAESNARSSTEPKVTLSGQKNLLQVDDHTLHETPTNLKDKLVHSIKLVSHLMKLSVQTRENKAEYDICISIEPEAIRTKYPRADVTKLIEILVRYLASSNDLILSRKPGRFCSTQYLKIAATQPALLREAEVSKLEKKTHDGFYRPFKRAEGASFIGFSEESKFFSSAEKQNLTLQILQNRIPLRNPQELVDVLGEPLTKVVTIEGQQKTVHFFEGQHSLISGLSQKGIVKVFPVHNGTSLENLRRTWVEENWFLPQPLEKIRAYYGEKIAFYFAFIEFYTSWFVFPCLLGLVMKFWQSWHGYESAQFPVIYAIVLCLWVTLFLEFWKRTSSTLAWQWGVSEYEEEEEDRPEFETTDVRISPVTKKEERYYPAVNRYPKYLVTVLVTLALLAVSCGAMLACYAVGDMIPDDQIYIKLLPSIAYAVSIPLLNGKYKEISKQLTDWENHQTQTDYENVLIIKMFLFEFFNYNIGLFYAAFWKRDIHVLRKYMVTMLITFQLIGQVQEVVIPYFSEKYRLFVRKIKTANSDSLPRKVEIEDTMQVYESTYDDMLEMAMQFGYVAMFSSAFPLAALCAFLNNVVEIRSDAFKISNTCQRPRAYRAAGIGIWYWILESLSIIAVITNCAIIGYTSEVFNGPSRHADDDGDAQLLFVFVLLEHGILILKVLAAWLIPDVPTHIALQMERKKHLDKTGFLEETKTKLE